MNTSIYLIERLQRPKGIVDVVLDTDAYNEIDDQFAISYALCAPEKVRVQAFYAAPFYNKKSENAADGMEKSYQEILKLLKLAKREEYEPLTFRGSNRYLPDENTPVESPAARDLAERAMKYSVEKPLYVLAIGAITNVASALLMNPEIKNRLVIVWLGGNMLEWPDNKEFNLYQDIAAGRVVFGCGAPVVQIPCMGVVDHLTTTKHELNAWLRGHNELCDYLCDNTIYEAESYAAGKPWSRVIWDISTVAWLLDENENMMKSKLIPSPIVEYDHHYSQDFRRHPVSYVYAVNRDAIFESLFTHLCK